MILGDGRDGLRIYLQKIIAKNTRTKINLNGFSQGKNNKSN
ncbi:hypothetical protein SAMN05428961_112115 [Paenibacillus sp. OK060]|nr:hypothetical protein SAMN05428961_112115 [Paenibacillus sp. OK060]